MAFSRRRSQVSDNFFTHPILNSPYEYPRYHWELDSTGQPTGVRQDGRRPASFVTPVPAPKKRGKGQKELQLDELSTESQRYDINELRIQVDRWRELKDPATWPAPGCGTGCWWRGWNRGRSFWGT
jgi:type III restriction enzyme